MVSIRSAFATLILVVTTTASSIAVAQDEAPPPEVARARALFDEATQHHQDARFALAAESYQGAYDLLRSVSHPGAPLVLFNLAASLAEIPGRECEAKAVYVRFLQEADATNEQVQQNLGVVQVRIRELEARSGDCSDTTATDASEPPVPDTRVTTSVSPVGPIVMGVGGALLIGAAVTGGLALAENDAFEAECSEPGACPVSAAGMLDSAHTLALVTDILWIGGAVVAAAGLVLTLTLTDTEETQVSAACGSHGCGVFAAGSF